MNQAPATKKEVESDSPLNGRCHCGAISYEFPCPPTEKVEPFSISSESRVVPPSMQKYPERGTRPHTNKWRATHCHCGGCRKTVGALMMDWVDMKANNLKITRNGPSGQYRITDFAMREFCQTCGTSLFLFYEKAGYAAVSIASITTPYPFDYIEYTEHIWVEDAKELVLDEAGKGGGLAGVMNDGLPRLTRNRSSEALS